MKVAGMSLSIKRWTRAQQGSKRFRKLFTPFFQIVTFHFMRNRSPSASRRHQIVLSLSPQYLYLLHFQWGLLGWKRKNVAQLALSEGEDFLTHIQTQLSKCVLQWKVPQDAYVYWVLAGDILGIVPSDASDVGLAAALPFGVGDTRTQPDLFSSKDRPSLMWIHKDWIAEIERISSHCQLSLVEVFARAQLFQRNAARFNGVLKAVLEQEEHQYFLHIFATTGEMLRTRVLDQQNFPSLQATLQAEFAGLSAGQSGEKPERAQLLAPAQLITLPSEWHDFDCHALAPISHLNSLEQLWRSELEGIVIRSTHDDLVRGLKLWSVALGAAGLACLGLMAWHDGKLQRQIEDGRVLVRKDLPKVEAAKALKSATLKMADAVDAAKTTRENTNSMTAFTQILANFPPSPATLLYIRTNEHTLAFVGTGDESSVKWIQERTYPGYEPLIDLPVPDFLQSSQPIIHFQARKSAPNSNSAPPAAPPASASASRTVTP